MVYGLWTNPLVLWSMVYGLTLWFYGLWSCGLTLQTEPVMEGGADPLP